MATILQDLFYGSDGWDIILFIALTVFTIAVIAWGIEKATK